MNEQELQLAVIGYIVATKKQPKSEQEVQAIAQEVASMKQSNPQQYQQLVQMGQQAQQQQAGAKVAALGSKLNYIRKIKGLCPEGEELVYMKEGGRVCPKCIKKAQKGSQTPKKKENPINQWKSDRAKAKDEAARDSIAINKYNDQETMVNKGHKGKFNPKKKNSTGGATWEPDRSKYKADKNACGAKMKKKK